MADDPALARAFGFTAADLQANRDGRLTPRQAEAVAGIHRDLRRYGTLAAIAIATSVLIIEVPLVLTIGLDNVLVMREAVIANAVVVSLLVGIFLVAQVAGHVRSRDVRSGRVSRAEGPAGLATRQYRRSIGTAYYVTVGGTRFQVATKRQFDAFQAGAAYRVFFIRHPPTHHILSVEWFD